MKLKWSQIYNCFLRYLLITEMQHLKADYNWSWEMAREKTHKKRIKAGKNVIQIKSQCIVLIWWLSATDWLYLKMMNPSDFKTVYKPWVHDKRSMYNYELCITKYCGVVRLFIDSYIMSDSSETLLNFSRKYL